MQSSHSSKSASNKLKKFTDKINPTLEAAITWICRIAIGATFVFSGFVKAIDPWGTYYKFTEYLSALGLSMLPNLVLACVFALCALEFLVGVFMLFGCYRKSSPVVAALFMLVMLPLTFWVAVSDPVKDCGCFGDFLIISNWATFWKNVALTAMTVWLLIFNRRQFTVISPAFQWMAVVASLAFIGAITFSGYFRQPLLDFRPYAVGQPLTDGEEETDEPRFVFIYEKEGVKKEFGEDDELPSEEDGWVFVERREITPNQSAKKAESEKTFRIWDKAGENDVTDSVLEEEGSQMLLLIPSLPEVSPATTWRINALYDWTSDNDIEMDAVVSGNSQEISDWEDLSMPQYDIYTADDTAIKEVARGNPAVVYLENGKVMWKSTLSSLDVDALKTLGKNGARNVMAFDGKDIVKNWSYIYLGVMAFLVMLSMLPRIKNAYFSPESRSRRRESVPRNEETIRDDKARPEE